MLCPCCRQPLSCTPQLLISLENNVAVARGRFVKLQPDWAVLASLLLRTWPNFVTYGHIEHALWGTGRVHQPDDPTGTVRTQISKLRKALLPLGYGIVPVIHEGYRLVDRGEPVNIHTSLTFGKTATRKMV